MSADPRFSLQRQRAERPLALTMGDPAGIGPEIIIKALAQNPALLNHVWVVGDVGVMQRAQTVCGVNIPMRALNPQAAAWGDSPQGTLHVVPTSALNPLPVFGQVQAVAGQAAAQAIEWAAKAALRGLVGAVVTAPIHKEALHAAGYRFPGHTEMLQALAAEHQGAVVEQVPVHMMLSNRELRTVLVSIHVSLRQAIEAVTRDNVLAAIEATHRHAQRAGWPRSRLAVAGLNPHAGEGGLMGAEERSVIEPAIAQARQAGIDAHGPFAPDTIFMRARQGEFDAVIAMYHDQGLIPVKYMGLSEGVNTTLGLPFVRTSPDHGTAFDVAGTGQADPASLLEAIAQTPLGQSLHRD